MGIEQQQDKHRHSGIIVYREKEFGREEDQTYGLIAERNRGRR